MIWPFNRKQKEAGNNIPSEVTDYYQAERRERTGLAWLLAVGTLLVTVAVVLGLFFGGRWVYRKVVHKDNKATPTVAVTQSPTDNSSSSQSSTSTTTPQTSSTSTSTPNTTPTTTTQSTTPATTSNTSSNPLPNTGPGNVLGIFVVTTVVGAVAHHLRARRLNSTL